MSHEQFIVGVEHDPALTERLGNVLRSLGYNLDTSWHGIGGSQEIGHWVVASPKGQLIIEAETYVGLSVTGPSELVAQVKAFFPVLPANYSLKRTAAKGCGILTLLAAAAA